MKTRIKHRLIALAAAIVAAAGMVTFAATALPAQAINCAYGDNFYKFNSDLTGDYATVYTESPNGHNGQYLLDYTADGTLFCQTMVEVVNGVSWFEWVQKGTASCATVDAADNYIIKMDGCAGLDSQFWTLADQLHGTEDWGNMANYYAVSRGYNGALYDSGSSSTFVSEQCESFTYPPTPSWCSSQGTNWDWSLVGPYR